MLPPTGPQRALAGSVFAVTVGGGLLLGSSTLYLTRIVGMSATEVGTGLTVGAVAGLAAGPLMGHVADRRGPREVHIVTMLCGAAATTGFVLVRSFWALVLVSLFTTLVSAAGQASRAPLIRAVAAGRTTWFLSYQRAISNVGIMGGMLIATIGIQLDTGPVYITMILVAAATFVVAGLVLTRIPHVEPLAVIAGQGSWIALRDRPYLLVALINGAMSVHLAIPAFALPLWIVNSTSTPRIAVTGFVLLNGILIVALQVQVSRGVVSPAAAARRMVWAGAALLLSLGLIGAMAGVPWWVALLLLSTATVVYTFGELWHAAASFELAFGLAMPHAQGQYAGAFGLGQGAANAAGPAILAVLCIEGGLPGWLLLGAAMMSLGLVTPIAVRWAERTRSDASSASEAPATPAVSTVVT
ncbi:MFS transporter [Solwaraspora sp. WMMD406]|uniref:MFS transporter n=1 Tax=Solwaraspora sp. WMMD406 TaxID=3016095 RepID=UPI002416C1A7|nr:MFS transporter [Solwaraspora sp. WMMD406]MDG4767684.1 MFS transporter [Solwaraspora sp. WMMD406]